MGIGVGGIVLVFPLLLLLLSFPVIVWQHPHLPLQVVASRLGEDAVSGHNHWGSAVVCCHYKSKESNKEKEKRLVIEQIERQTYLQPIGSDRGNPQVYFAVPLPIPMNTILLQVGVRCYPWVLGGFHG